jgi:hypothetical protein
MWENALSLKIIQFNFFETFHGLSFVVNKSGRSSPLGPEKHTEHIWFGF